MSIHKSQGQTIQRVKIDLGKVFEKGKSAGQSSCRAKTNRSRSQGKAMSPCQGQPH
ncbi:hypothetical protein BJ138DRAFT_1151140 [Hygrophoropsis aurantiaca]|uniref:Uncharacterized protein n=1 Tax=Hygrophoropsis aurantiaca TaxID=72124 RepID=A0ACB8ADS9_9AGAM|nr:hypothetical protein BJ138DRAFT_1151140 [Hygrophoropsis aurantiaca]